MLVFTLIMDKADKVSHLQRRKVSIAINTGDPFNSLGWKTFLSGLKN